MRVQNGLKKYDVEVGRVFQEDINAVLDKLKELDSIVKSRFG